jgi:hypothetical protein
VPNGHRLPTAPAIALLQDAMPRPGLPLVHFNDTRCGSVTELAAQMQKSADKAWCWVWLSIAA